MRTLCLLLIGATAAFAQSERHSDVEMWNEVDVAAHLSAGPAITVPLVMRDSFTLANPQLAGTGITIDVPFAKALTFSGGYLFVTLPGTDAGYKVHVPLAALTLQQKFGSFRLSDRNRAEGLLGIPNSPIRYRNKLSIDLLLVSGRWIPFVSDEAVYDFSRSCWSQNRFQTGLGRKLSSTVRLNTYFLQRNSHNSNPKSTHAICLGLEIDLKSKNELKRSTP